VSRSVAYILDRSLLLVAGTVAALLWANTWPASYGALAHSLHFAINDIGMAFFFGLATKEIVESTLPGGPLASPKAAAVPLLAAAAGMIAPAALYWGAAVASGHPELARGWAIPCATDIAFSYLVARLIFPARHPAIPFLLLLAVADDALGLLVLAVFYPAGVVSPLLCALFMVPAVAIAWGLRRRRVRSFWPYLVLAGSCSWTGLYLGGLHPALALVPIVPFMLHEVEYHDLFDEACHRAADTLNRFAAWWRVPVQVMLFLFGLANAGVPLSGVGPATWLVAAALLVGKPAGIVLMTVLAARAGLARPAGVGYGDVMVIGVTAGIGFTVALFFATAAFPPGPALDAAKMGALLSFLGAPLAIGLARIGGSTDTAPDRDLA
jgi:Na+:H+ antiporter, NhaA family